MKDIYYDQIKAGVPKVNINLPRGEGNTATALQLKLDLQREGYCVLYYVNSREMMYYIKRKFLHNDISVLPDNGDTVRGVVYNKPVVVIFDEIYESKHVNQLLKTITPSCRKGCQVVEVKGW